MQKIHSSSDDVEPQQTQPSPEQMRIDFDYVPTWWSPQLISNLLSRLRKTVEVTVLTREQTIQEAVDTSIAEAAQRIRSSANNSPRRDAEIDRYEQARDEAVYEALVNREEEYDKKRA